MSAPPTISSSMNLYLDATTSSISGVIPLFIQGNSSGTAYILNNLDLFLNGSAFTGSINLFLNGISEPGSIEEELNLFLQATYNQISANCDLILLGTSESVSGLDLMDLTLQELDDLTLLELYDLPLCYVFAGWPLSNSCDLFINGLGVTPNSIPISGSMNLYLQGPQGIIGSIPLFMPVSTIINNNINLDLFGVLGVLSNNVTLYAKGINLINGNCPLFIRGYNPNEY